MYSSQMQGVIPRVAPKSYAKQERVVRLPLLLYHTIALCLAKDRSGMWCRWEHAMPSKDPLRAKVSRVELLTKVLHMFNLGDLVGR